MKLAGFLQVRNELKSGHLRRYLDYNPPLLDYLCVIDDCSNDGTADYLVGRCDLLLTSPFRGFKSERTGRSRLLRSAKETFKDIDWFLWLDADECLLLDRQELEQIIVEAETTGCDSIELPLANVWTNENRIRVDSGFGDLVNTRLWKNSTELSFDEKPGLHLRMHPDRGLSKTLTITETPVIHFGFQSAEEIAAKFVRYRKLGQKGPNLWRLIDEREMVLSSIDEVFPNLGARASTCLSTQYDHELKTDPINIDEYLWLAQKIESDMDSGETVEPFVTLISLIYSGVDWLEFQYSELLKLQNEIGADLVSILFVANDANEEVLQYLRENYIPHVVAPGANANEWYINSVYRAYNFGVKQATTKWVVLTNSDMYYSKGFLSSLLKNPDPKRYLVGKLVESGTLKPSIHAVKKNYGKNLSSFRGRRFEKFAQTISTPKTTQGGLFMPCLIERNVFLRHGGYPEGNLQESCLDEYLISGAYEVASIGEPCIPGDRAFIKKLEREGVTHETSLSSIAYHFQEGEKRRRRSRLRRKPPSGFAICNDLLIGINGEQTLWNYLIDDLSNSGASVQEWPVYGKNEFLHLLFRKYFSRHRPRVLFQNGSFIKPIPGKWRRVVLLQDRLTGKMLNRQNGSRRKADVEITNSTFFINDGISGNHQYLMQLPLNSFWEDAQSNRSDGVPYSNNFVLHGVFIGAFNETKGWDSVREVIVNNPDILFTVVSKYSEDDPKLPKLQANNCVVMKAVDATTIRRTLENANFFILGSKFETQCLAAIEAATCNVPIIMPRTGLLGNFPEETRNMIGEFGDDLALGLLRLRSRILEGDIKLEPALALQIMGISSINMRAQWFEIFQEELRMSFLPQAINGRLRSKLKGVVGASAYSVLSRNRLLRLAYNAIKTMP